MGANFRAKYALPENVRGLAILQWELQLSREDTLLYEEVYNVYLASTSRGDTTPARHEL